MLNIIRYVMAGILFMGLFYSISISIPKETISSQIDKKLPKTIKKKGGVIVLNNLEINDISNNIVNATIYGTLSMDMENETVKKTKGFFSKVFKNKKIIENIEKKSFNLKINVKSIPQIKDNKLSFKIKEIDLNNKYANKKSVKNLVIKTLEKLRIKIKVLEKYSFLTSVKSIKFLDNGDLTINLKINSFLLLLLIPLFLLREIGLLLIEIYQRWFSSKKGYKCAKGHLHGKGTCSSDTKKAFKEGGFISGMKEYRKSKKECKEAYDKITAGEATLGGCDACSNGLLFSSRAKGAAIGTGGLEATTGAVSSGAEMGAGACDAGACDVGACDVGAC